MAFCCLIGQADEFASKCCMLSHPDRSPNTQKISFGMTNIKGGGPSFHLKRTSSTNIICKLSNQFSLREMPIHITITQCCKKLLHIPDTQVSRNHKFYSLLKSWTSHHHIHRHQYLGLYVDLAPLRGTNIVLRWLWEILKHKWCRCLRFCTDNNRVELRSKFCTGHHLDNSQLDTHGIRPKNTCSGDNHQSFYSLCTCH